MKILKELYDNQPLKEAWAAFIIEQLNAEALERVYAGKDTSAVKEAHDIIRKSFVRLNELFTEKPKPKGGTRAE